MSEDNRAGAALRHFIVELNAAWEAAGPPSYARLEKLSIDFSSSEQAGGLRLRVLAASTTHEILRGKRRSLPEWAWVVSFVNVLRVAAVENGLNPDVVGSIAEWKAKHQVARLRLRGTGPSPAAAPAREDDADPPDMEWLPGPGPPPARDPMSQVVRLIGQTRAPRCAWHNGTCAAGACVTGGTRGGCRGNAGRGVGIGRRAAGTPESYPFRFRTVRRPGPR